VLLHGAKAPELLQYVAPSPPSSSSQPVLFWSQPAARHSSVVVQGLAQVPLLSRTLPDGHGSAHTPLAQRPLQQSVLPVQVAPIDPHVGGASAQVPLSSQLPLQHCVSFLHFFPLRLQPIGAAAASPMPTDASVPPRRAAPINLSALPRVMLPLASPLASSSKERSEVCWLTCAPLSRRAGH
jgi:hypothetical protein